MRYGKFSFTMNSAYPYCCVYELMNQIFIKEKLSLIIYLTKECGRKYKTIRNIGKLVGLSFCASLLMVLPAQAITITGTGTTSGGAPGGLPILQAAITDADIGDSFNMD